VAEPIQASRSEPSSAKAESNEIPDVCLAPVQVPAGQIHYESLGGRFSVVLPRRPTPGVGDDRETESDILVHESYAFVAKHGVLPRGAEHLPADLLLDAGRDGAAKAAGTAVKWERRISCYGRPGREFALSSEDGAFTCRAREFIAGDESFFVSVTAPTGQEESVQASVYLDSFRPVVTPQVSTGI
jgi:hypothetical protein